MEIQYGGLFFITKQWKFRSFFAFYFTILNKFSESSVAMSNLVLVRVIFYPSATLFFIYSKI